MTVTMSELMGTRIKMARGVRGLSLMALSDRMEVGSTAWDHTKLSRVEQGLRALSVEEWLIVSLALDVDPIWLLQPLEGLGVTTGNADLLTRLTSRVNT